jgi:hypothetical protein
LSSETNSKGRKSKIPVVHRHSWKSGRYEECAIASADTLPMEKEADELIAIMTTMINRTKSKTEMWGRAEKLKFRKQKAET